MTHTYQTTQTTHGHRVDKCTPTPYGDVRRESMGTFFTEAEAAEYIRYETGTLEITR